MSKVLHLPSWNNALKASIVFTHRRAIKEADTILLLGARLNWILHFGQPPRFHENVKILQVSDFICSYDLIQKVKNCIWCYFFYPLHLKCFFCPLWLLCVLMCEPSLVMAVHNFVCAPVYLVLLEMCWFVSLWKTFTSVVDFSSEIYSVCSVHLCFCVHILCELYFNCWNIIYVII